MPQQLGENMAIIDVEPDYEYVGEVGAVESTMGWGEVKIVRAIEDLEVAVVEAFKQHDRDLRSEVEKVNSQIRWLIGTVALVGAVLLLGRFPTRS